MLEGRATRAMPCHTHTHLPFTNRRTSLLQGGAEVQADDQRRQSEFISHVLSAKAVRVALTEEDALQASLATVRYSKTGKGVGGRSFHLSAPYRQTQARARGEDAAAASVEEAAAFAGAAFDYGAGAVRGGREVNVVCARRTVFLPSALPSPSGLRRALLRAAPHRHRDAP